MKTWIDGLFSVATGPRMSTLQGLTPQEQDAIFQRFDAARIQANAMAAVDISLQLFSKFDLLGQLHDKRGLWNLRARARVRLGSFLGHKLARVLASRCLPACRLPTPRYSDIFGLPSEIVL